MSRRFRRLTRAVAAILPAAALTVLPKCPLCLAAWLTLATGMSFSVTGAAWLRASLIFCGATVPLSVLCLGILLQITGIYRLNGKNLKLAYLLQICRLDRPAVPHDS